MEKTIILETKDSHLILKVADIIRIEATQTKSFVLMKSGKKIMHAAGMDFWVARLHEHPFIRVHDHHMVNLHSIDSYDLTDQSCITMNSGEKIGVQKKYKVLLNEFFDDYLEN